MTKPITKHHTKYYQGNSPIILSTPHDGDLRPKEIKDRTKGYFCKDDYTYELTKLIIEEFYLQTKLTPYSIIAEISREKIDFNREEKEAYEDKNAKVSYDTFHNFIKTAKNEVSKNFNKGLYIDIHGQSHPDAFLEFGYLLDNDILKLNDEELEKFKGKSSIKTMSEFSKESFIEQLKGVNSMGTLMTEKGFKSIPSKKYPYAKDDKYFEGKDNTIKYGSLNGGSISGIQIEFPYKNCRDSKENRKECAKAFVSSIIKFMQIHFNINLHNL